LLPHEVIAAMSSSSKYGYDNVMLGHHSDEDRVAFWQHGSNLDPWAKHPINPDH
jgi:hypothetical protein